MRRHYSLMELSREVTEFIDCMYNISKSESVKFNIRNSLRSFDKFCHSKYNRDIMEVVVAIKRDLLDRYRVQKDYVQYLINIGNKPNTIRVKLTYAREFLVDRDIEINPIRVL